MRKLIIISSYPNTPEREKTLIDCINAVSNKGYDILVASHCPVSTEIQNMVNYCVFDKDNSHSSYDDSPFYWIGNDSFHFITKIKGHALAICRSMANSFAIAKFQKYDYFVFMESDNIFSESDFLKFEILREEMIKEDKKMFFFKCEWIDEYVGPVSQYDTLVFGGMVNWFNDHMDLPLSPQDWSKWTVHKILEKDFYAKLGEFEQEFIIPSDMAVNYFKDSIINKNTLVNICEVALDERNGNYLLFLINFCDKDLLHTVNGVDIALGPGMWWWSTINNDVNVVTMDLKTKEVLDRKFIEFDKLDIDEVKDKTNLKFR